MSAECVTLVVRSFWVSTPFTPGFSCSWTMTSCFSLERVCHEVFGFPVVPLPTLTPKIDAACSSSLVHGFPISTWGWDPLPRCRSYLFSAYLQHSSPCRSTQHAVLSVPFPLTCLEHVFFLLLERPYLGIVQKDRENTGFQNVFLCL